MCQCSEAWRRHRKFELAKHASLGTPIYSSVICGGLGTMTCGEGLWPADACGFAGDCLAGNATTGAVSVCKCTEGWRSARFAWLAGRDVCSVNDTLLLVAWISFASVFFLAMSLSLPLMARAVYKRKGAARRRVLARVWPMFGMQMFAATFCAYKFGGFFTRYLFQDTLLTVLHMWTKALCFSAHMQYLSKFRRYLDTLGPVSDVKHVGAATGLQVNKAIGIILLIQVTYVIGTVLKSEGLLRVALLLHAGHDIYMAFASTVLIEGVRKEIRKMLSYSLGDDAMRDRLAHAQITYERAQKAAVGCFVAEAFCNVVFALWPLAFAHMEAFSLLLMVHAAASVLAHAVVARTKQKGASMRLKRSRMLAANRRVSPATRATALSSHRSDLDNRIIGTIAVGINKARTLKFEETLDGQPKHFASETQLTSTCNSYTNPSQKAPVQGNHTAP